MAFKVKDLMIEVMGGIPYITGTVRPPCMCTSPTRPCLCSNWRTPIPTCVYNATTRRPVACEAGTVGCGASWDPTTPVFQTETIIQQTPVLQQEEIAPLKEQLKAALELVEKQEAAINEQLQPKTLEDVNLLESKLTEALGELRVQKAALERKAK